MKLVVRFSDFHERVVDMIHIGVMPPVNYRTVSIELTPEQALQLVPRTLGQSGRQPIFETREVISLEDSKGVYKVISLEVQKERA